VIFAEVTENECIDDRHLRDKVHPVWWSAKVAKGLPFIFQPKLTLPAVQSLCDSWATCSLLCVEIKFW